MAKLKNTDKIFNLAIGDSVTVGNNRTITRRKYGNGFGFQCQLHGHGVAFFGMTGIGEIAHVTLNDCGFRTQTTAAAMSDFARAFGCALSVSMAKGGIAFRFKNGAGAWVDREGQTDAPNGPYALGRYV